MLGCTGNFEVRHANTIQQSSSLFQHSPQNPSADPATTPQTLYIHGYVSGRIFKSGKSASSPGLPITVAASFLDGLVLSLTPFHNSCNYRSAIVYGYAQLVQDADEALYAMKAITDNLLPQRWEKSRTPPTSAELKSTSILKITIESASAKIRTGGPSEDRKDLEDEELVKKTWTGVVPYWGTWGEPVAGRENACEEVEEYIEGWRVGETSRARGYAFEAVGMDGKGK
jgi:nitroimidazol reductase NimA-like FMN-containing flavoprotein (pyridoxamine 5'-phosphate oxidase superfamily)